MIRYQDWHGMECRELGATPGLEYQYSEAQLASYVHIAG